MSRRQQYRQRLCILLAISLVLICGYFYSRLRNSIPNYVRMEVGSGYPIQLSKYLNRTLQKEVMQTTSNGNSNIPKDAIKMDVSSDAILDQEEVGSYIVEYKLLGFLKIKSVYVDIVEKQSLVPCGFPVGIYVETDGILVIGTGAVTGINGESYEPAENIMKSGDYITSINGEQVATKQQLIEKITNYGGDDIILGVRRNNEEMQLKLKAVETGNNEYKLGIWIRDNTQGVGMMTYVTEDGKFGALGHGINDVDTGLLMEINRGKLLRTEIISINKSIKGNPGELVGLIDYKDSNIMGNIEKNTSEGIFGSGNEALSQNANQETLEVGMKQEVKKGAATILSCINNTIEEYEIEIIEVNQSEKNENKGFVIQVTDEGLLSETGGIVQGMSGSPIIQNGKIIGAVTHVFIQDSTKGYGIFIENMLRSQSNS